MEQNLCVLIDFENVAAGTEKEGLGRFDIRAVFRRLKDKGRILVARSYGDWGRFAKFKQSLLEAGVTMVELTSYRGAEKNRADIALVVDCMELAFTRDYIDTFVLLSGDSDFTPLVHKLREMNKRVIGIGTRGSTSRLLIESCDEFIFYKSLKSQPSEPPERERERERRPPAAAAAAAPIAEDLPPSLSKDQAFLLVVETVQGIQRDEPGSVLAGMVKQSMKRKDPTFDESEYGYSGFGRFLEAAEKKGLVVLSKDEKAGGYRVDLPGEEGEVSATEPEQEIEDELPPLEGRAGELREVLIEEGVNPLTPLMRHTVVHEFADHVVERTARKKRNTLMYTIGDIGRRCRKTDPQVPPRFVRSVITALFRAGTLIHPDGKPVRSQSAPFTIQAEPEELLRELQRFYVRVLLQAGENLDDSVALSLLFHSDEGHAEELRQVVLDEDEALARGGGTDEYDEDEYTDEPDDDSSQDSEDDSSEDSSEDEPSVDDEPKPAEE